MSGAEEVAAGAEGASAEAAVVAAADLLPDLRVPALLLLLLLLLLLASWRCCCCYCCWLLLPLLLMRAVLDVCTCTCKNASEPDAQDGKKVLARWE